MDGAPVTVLLWIGVGLLGGVGAVARSVVSDYVAARAGTNFPYGTLVVNVSGAFLLGLLTGLSVEGDRLLLLDTGVLSAYTTFSTWMVETHALGARRRWAAVVANVAGSLIVGVAATALGRAIGAG